MYTKEHFVVVTDTNIHGIGAIHRWIGDTNAAVTGAAIRAGIQRGAPSGFQMISFAADHGAYRAIVAASRTETGTISRRSNDSDVRVQGVANFHQTK